MPPSVNDTAGIAGLSSEEARTRLQQFGINDPAPSRRSPAILDLLRLFLNPLVLILLIAAILSAFLGEAADAGIIIAIVILSVVIDFVQTYRSRRAVEQLRERVAPPPQYFATRSGRKSADAMSSPATWCDSRPGI